MVFETLKSDQYLISPYSNAVKLFIKIMRIKEMIGNLISFDLQMNSPCQYQKRHIEKSRENMDTKVTPESNIKVMRTTEIITN